MAAQPTPQTLRVFQMINDINIQEQTIIQYVTNNQARIDVNYANLNLPMLLAAAYAEHQKLAKKLLELGAVLNNEIIENFITEISFIPPVRQAKELMNALLQAGFPREKMLHLLCGDINGTHKELLKTLLEQPIDINFKYEDNTAIYLLIMAFAEGTEDERGVFMEMLRALIHKGANPNEVGHDGRTAIQLVNQAFEGRNPRAILRALPIAPVVPVAPAGPAAPDWLVDLRVLEAARNGPARAPAGPAAPVAPAAPIPSADYKKLWAEELKKPSPDIAKLEEYKNAGGIDVNDYISPNNNPLIILLSRKPDLKVIEALLKWGANPNMMKDGIPIFWDIFNRSINDIKPLLQLFLKYGTDAKIVANNQTSVSTYIHSILNKTATEFSKKHKEIADLLIENGADIHFRNQYGDILDSCIRFGNEPAIEYLLQKGMSMLFNGKTRFYYYSLGQISMNNSDIYVGIVSERIINFLNKMLKFYKNTNMYFRDFLDVMYQKPESTIPPYIYKNIIDILKPNFNEVYEDGSTPLIKAVQAHTRNPAKWIQDMIQIMIEKGANVAYTDPTGKKAANYTTDAELRDLLLEPTGFKILWTGFSRADIDFTNMIFQQTTHASNLAKLNPQESLFSTCPVCLKYIQHETGTCMYMTHSCVEQAGYEGYYHKKLWNAFSYGKQYDAFGRNIPVGQQKRVIEWCTNCGRICKGHMHYLLQPIYKAGTKEIEIPKLSGSGVFFATDCSKPGIGGGGIKEKLNRYRRFREIVLALNKPSVIGKMTYEEAINILVEAVWEAPLDPRRFEISMIQAEKKFNSPVANTRFPLPSELPAPPRYVYESPVYPDAANPDLLPLVYAKADNVYKNSAYNVFGDDENIVQFRHRQKDGTVNTHAGANQQIALGRLIGYLQHMCDTPQAADFGMCWQHAHDGYTMVNDKAHMPPKCTAKLYPEEVLSAIQKATVDDATNLQYMNVYKLYQKRYAERFGRPIGLANTNTNNENASNRKNMEGGTRRCRNRNHNHNRLSKKRMTIRRKH